MDTGHSSQEMTPPNVEIREVRRLSELRTIAELARSIWPGTYKEILSPAQISYMLDWMYDPEKLMQERADGIRFLLLYDEKGVPSGFASFGHCTGEPRDTAILHKLYLEPRLHGCGIGSALIQDIFSKLKRAGFHRILLHVNKENTKAIRAYERNGFIKLRSECNDIGCGYQMNDFVMERELV